MPITDCLRMDSTWWSPDLRLDFITRYFTRSRPTRMCRGTLRRSVRDITCRAQSAFADLNDNDFAGMFVSGGRAPEYLRYDADLLRLTKAIADAGKPIACLCHGIEILSAADCIRGKRVTTVPKCALDAEQGGATYSDEPYVVDGRLVTGRGYQDNTEVLREFIQQLKAASPV